MSELELYETHMVARNGTPVRLLYDEAADILEIFFGDNEPATGVELTDHIVLRVNRDTRRAVSLLLLNFSILTEQTEYGPRSFPLDKLYELPDDLQELVLQLVTSLPVSQFLKTSQFQVSPTEQVPSAYVDVRPAAAKA